MDRSERKLLLNAVNSKRVTNTVNHMEIVFNLLFTIMQRHLCHDKEILHGTVIICNLALMFASKQGISYMSKN